MASRTCVLGETLLRFVFGGAIVACFTLAGEVFRPKTFSGIFGAAPSVALATVALTYAKDGALVVAVLGRSMVVGAVALFAYGIACVAATKREHWPVWLSATCAWAVWFAVAFGLWGTLLR